MTTFTVHAPAGDVVAAARDDLLVFVPEKASFAAFLVPMLWAPWRRLWEVFLGSLVVTVAIQVIGARLDPRLGAILSLAFAVWFALVANDLRRWTLERRGHRLVAVVEADDVEAAEARFLAGLADPARPRFGEVERPSAPPAAAPSVPAHVAPSRDLPPVVGWAPSTGVRP
ncbi:MAG: DUF2628 domain-containing protein [Phyllobacteriaceae bacterium]|nr:DUF2628 domain-containing protein [Phyllobacteriaceae bacterium]